MTACLVWILVAGILSIPTALRRRADARRRRRALEQGDQPFQGRRYPHEL